MDFENNTENTAAQQTLPIDEIMPSILNGNTPVSPDNVSETAAQGPAQNREDVSAADGTDNSGENVQGETQENAPTEAPGDSGSARMMSAFEDTLSRLEAANRELVGLREKNKELALRLSEQNEVQKDALDNLEGVLPEIDFTELSFLPEDEQRTKMADFVKSIADYSRRETLKELSPIMDEYNRGKAQSEEAAVYDTFARSKKFADISDHRSAIESIISNTPELKSLPLEKRIMLAYLADRGAQSINTPPVVRTSSDIAKEAMADPEVMRIIAQANFKEASDTTKDLPPVSRSHGYGNSPVSVMKKPASIDEVTNRLYENLK